MLAAGLAPDTAYGVLIQPSGSTAVSLGAGTGSTTDRAGLLRLTF